MISRLGLRLSVGLVTSPPRNTSSLATTSSIQFLNQMHNMSMGSPDPLTEENLRRILHLPWHSLPINLPTPPPSTQLPYSGSSGSSGSSARPPWFGESARSWLMNDIANTSQTKKHYMAIRKKGFIVKLRRIAKLRLQGVRFHYPCHAPHS